MSDVFRTPPPNVKTELVQEFLYANFDIIASIEKLSSDRDLNLKVSTDDKSFVMKIANSSEDKSILQMQNDALRYISSQDESIEVPIPIKSKHRLSNPEKDPLILIEIQIGSYLGEDDITRFDDLYGRQIK